MVEVYECCIKNILSLDSQAIRDYFDKSEIIAPVEAKGNGANIEFPHTVSMFCYGIENKEQDPDTLVNAFDKTTHSRFAKLTF